MKSITLSLISFLCLVHTAGITAAEDKQESVEQKIQKTLEDVILENAVRRGDIATVQDLIPRCAGKIKLSCDERGNTLLHIASAHCSAKEPKKTMVGREIVKALLDAKADIDKRNNDGHTPLRVYCSNHKDCCAPIMHTLLLAGAKVTERIIEGAKTYRSESYRDDTANSRFLAECMQAVPAQKQLQAAISEK